MPAVREASTQVRYYQPEGFEVPGWLKWGLIAGAAWVGYDLYKYHTLPGPLETVYQDLRGQGGSGGGGSVGTPTTVGPVSQEPTTKAQQQALALFHAIPLQIHSATTTRYYYAGPYPRMAGYVGIAQYDAAGTLVRVFPQKYTSKLSGQIGAINTGTYRAPGHYTINPAKVG